MPGSFANKRERLIQPYMLFFLSAITLTTLFFVFPRKGTFGKPAYMQNPNRVSISYLRLLLDSQPQDSALRLTLVRQLQTLGYLKDAQETLKLLINTPGHEGIQARLIALNIRLAQLNALLSEDPQRQMIMESLFKDLGRVTRDPLQSADLVSVAELALAVGKPEIAVDLYVRLSDTETERSSTWLAEAARWSLATGQADKAGQLYALAADKTNDPRQSLLYAVQAIDALRAADQGTRALNLARSYLKRFPENKGLLDIAIAITTAQNNLREAVMWGRKRLAISPDNKNIIKSQFDRELASGNLTESLRLAERLVALYPEDIQARKDLAQVSEWAGRPDIALSQWSWLARLDSTGRAMANAIRLGDVLFNWQELADILIFQSKQRPLTEQELTTLVNALEALGKPKRAVSVVRRYLSRFPADRWAWEMLAGVQERQGELDSALESWDVITSRFEENIEDIVKQAELLWRLNKADQALKLLKRVQSEAGSEDIKYWKIFAELAWQREAYEDAKKGYYILWQNDEVGILAAERLMFIARAEGRNDEVVELGERSWAFFEKPRFLLDAMVAAAEAGLWQDLSRLLEKARHKEELFQDFEPYWLFRAELSTHYGRIQQTHADYEQALRLHPEFRSVRVNLLWFLIESGDKRNLARNLQRWWKEAVIDPSLWGVYAAALHSFGLAQEALPWYQRQMQVSPDEYLWLLSYADALEQAGRVNTAWRLRRYAFLKLRPRALKAIRQTSIPIDREFFQAYAMLARDIQGNVAAEGWLQHLVTYGMDDPLIREFAISWYLTQERIERARYWLLKQYVFWQKSPAVQRLALALADNDMEKVVQIMYEPGDISRLDRVEVSRRLGREDEALVTAFDGLEADDSSEEATLLKRQAMDLYRRLPNNIKIGWQQEEVGPLDIDQHKLLLQLSSGQLGFEGQIKNVSLHSNPADISLGENDEELDISLGALYRKQRSQAALHVGINQRADHDLLYGELSYEYNFRQGVQGGIELSLNELDDGSAVLRAVGAQDRVTTSFLTDLTQREYARTQLSWRRYRGRDGRTFARGYGAEMEIGHRLYLANPEWRFRVQGSLFDNHLNDVLPREVASFLPSGSSVETVVPGTYKSVGIGTTVQHGGLDAVASTETRANYLLDLWTGWEWPSNRYGYSLSFGIGMPVFGRDDLSVSTYYVSSQGGTGQASTGLELSYNLRLGR